MLKRFNHPRFIIASAALIFLNVTSITAFNLTGASWLGGGGDGDMVVGTHIRTDGNIVLAANIGDAQPGGVEPILLNGSTAATNGAVVVLDERGTSVLSVTRVASQLNDMSVDGSGNIYLAAATDGIIKLDASASTLLWKKDCGGYCSRLDAAEDGTVVGLDINISNTGKIFVYDKDNTELGTFSGHRRTEDVAISSATKLIYYIGWRNANTKANPVQISYMRAASYQGEISWTNYDWPAHLLDNSDGVPYGEVKPENNMADSRGYRISVGQDGKLYAAFEIAGGNHIFRYSPQDIMTEVTVVGGDMWHNFYNTKSEHKAFFARYDAITGDYVLGQQFCTRYWDQNKNRFNGNAARVRDGNIMADQHGRVYLVGPSASGLPIPKATGYEETEGQFAYNPFDEKVYTGGAYILIMSPDMTTRLYCTRLCGSTTRAVAVKHRSNATTIVWAGQAGRLGTDFKSNPAWLFDAHNPIQPELGGGEKEGFFAVMEADFSGETNALHPNTNQKTAKSLTYPVSKKTVIMKGTSLNSTNHTYYDLSGRRITADNINSGKRNGIAASVLIGVYEK